MCALHTLLVGYKSQFLVGSEKVQIGVVLGWGKKPALACVVPCYAAAIGGGGCQRPCAAKFVMHTACSGISNFRMYVTTTLVDHGTMGQPRQHMRTHTLPCHRT